MRLVEVLSSREVIVPQSVGSLGSSIADHIWSIDTELPEKFTPKGNDSGKSHNEKLIIGMVFLHYKYSDINNNLYLGV